MLFQIWMTYFLLLKIKESILKTYVFSLHEKKNAEMFLKLSYFMFYS